jgi:DNA-binding NarL/FixJ family response regulator
MTLRGRHARRSGGAPGQPTLRVADRIRILLIDEHRLLAEALGAVLGAEPDLQIVGVVSAPGEAVALARRTGADVAVLSYPLAVAEGGRHARAIGAQLPALKLLVLTSSGDDETIAACLEAGALGHVAKGSPPAELAAAIRRVHAGEALFAADVIVRLLIRPGQRAPAPGQRAPAAPAPAAGARPSARELEVLQLVVFGLSVAAMAERLCISEHTVRAHLKGASRKLGACSKLEATMLALKAGWIDLPD